MKKQGVDHVHAHFASHPAAAGFIIHRLVDIPYSFTAHGSDLHRDRHMLFEKVQAAAFVVAISEYNRELIINECQGAYSDKVAVIHCGVNADKFTFRIDETTHQKKLGEFKILCVGTLHEVKGQTYLIQACQKLLSAGINFSCHFIGDGPDKKVLSELVAKLDLNEKIVFHGRQTQDQIANFLQDVDVLVAPSVPTSDGRREGIPVVLIEAMSSGVPVIASNISGIPELVLNEQSGLLTPPRDSDALFIALERYYLDPGLRKRFAEAGRNTVINDFDLHQNAAKLVQKFRSESRL
jgi:glycosyltransferase involved in cell wall biosynthesis